MYARRNLVGSAWLGVGLLAFCTAAAWAGDVITKPAPARVRDAKYQSLELFAGVESGKLEAKLIPRDAKKARIFVTNKTSEPVNVRMPAVFAGQPVLAQFLAPGGGGNNGNQANGGVNQNNVPQTIGGRTNTNNNRFGGGSMFNVPAEKTAEFRVDCVCLEYGKPNPRPVVTYQLLAADKVANPETVAMLNEFEHGDYSQRAAQAAAWHLANAMSWEKLKGIKGELESLGVRAPYFTRQELDDAHKLVDAARERLNKEQPAKAQPPKAQPPTVTSPGAQAAR
jgi:hypothetical protein